MKTYDMTSEPAPPIPRVPMADALVRLSEAVYALDEAVLILALRDSA